MNPPSSHKRSSLHQKQQRLEIQLHRLRAQKAILEHHVKKSAHTQRRARTRTLIQMGGLLTLTILPAVCAIEEGEDLQLAIPAMDKAATLLGILLTFQDQLSPTLSSEALEAFKSMGLRHLKRPHRHRRVGRD